METAETARSESLDREWWLNTVAVLVRPRQVFEALRDDSDEAAGARQEPMAAIVFLGGIAAVLSTGAASRLLDDPLYDGLLIVLWAIVAGAIYGGASYLVVGGSLYVGQHAAGGTASFRQARHLLGLSAMPLLVWLVFVWPVRLALYGEDLFRTGGSDGHTGQVVFDAIGGLFVAWVVALLWYGLRTVYEWDWRRCAIALSVSLAAVVAFAYAAAIILRGA